MTAGVPARAWVAPMFLKLAVVYFVNGVLMGNYMGARLDFALSPVHAHINLLGWVSLALAGIIYAIYPRAGSSLLAVWHFWLANLSLPVMMVALAFFLRGSQTAGPVLGITSGIMAIAVILFGVNVLRNVRAGG